MVIVTRISRSVAAVVGGLLIAGLVPGTAWAPKVFHRTRITGTCTATFGAGTLAGELELAHFDVVGDALTVTGVLSGICTKDPVTWAEVPAQSVSLAATSPASSCDAFSFTFGGPVSLTSGSITIDPERPEIGAPVKGAKRMCVIDRHLDAGRLEPAARMLNTLI